MTTIQWDKVGDRVYESGVDRGVLYLPDGSGVPWNGLTSVTEKTSQTTTPVYFDGAKFADSVVVGDYAGTLKAYTYPDEFMQFEGVLEGGNGLLITGQRPPKFSLSYRTRIGNDVDGNAYGYKIHVLYNLTAKPAARSFIVSQDGTPTPFEWELTAIPERVPGYRATAHIIFDTRKMGAGVLADIERSLYGDGITPATLPKISSLVNFISDWVIIRIIDNGDGTWTAEVPDSMLNMLSPTTFEIINANAVYIPGEDGVYMISDLTY